MCVLSNKMLFKTFKHHFRTGTLFYIIILSYNQNNVETKSFECATSTDYGLKASKTIQVPSTRSSLSVNCQHF